MSVRAAILGALAVLAAGAAFAPALAARDAVEPSVEILTARRIGNVAVAGYRFHDFLDAEALERIAAGTPWSFRHRVEVVAPRRWLLMRRKVLAGALIETSVEFDPLTRRYALERRIRLKGLKDEGIGSRKISRVVDTLEEARTWLAEFRDVEVFHPSVAFPDEPLTLRVEAALGRRFVAWVLPVSITAAAEAPLSTDG